jgi:hypothetical protein
MLNQIALSAALLILAFTALPKLHANSEGRDTQQHVVEPEQPALRRGEPGEPRLIDVRATDPSTLNEIAHWLSTNFDLPYTNELPRLQRVPPAQLYRLRYKALLPTQSQAIGGEHSTPLPESQREIVAVYDDSSRTIYLQQAWTGATATDQSVLVHEMVHHLQNLGGLKYECPGAREKPAYLAQNAWLNRSGLELEKEFDVDLFTVVALSACMN